MAILQTLRIDHDHQNQIIWFSGALADGHQFSVGFPIAHIQVTFDQKASSMGWAGAPLCGSVVSIEGFFNTIKAASFPGSPVARIAQTAQKSTMQQMATQAAHYAVSAAKSVQSNALKSATRASHALPAIGAQGLAAFHAANIVASQTRMGTLPAATRRNVLTLANNPTNPLAAITLAALHSVRI